MAELDDLELANPHDPFASESKGEGGGKVHLRVQARNGRKSITTVQGLAEDLDVKKICKAFKKLFNCNGAVQEDDEMGKVIQLSGDQRQNVRGFLLDQEICSESQIVVHGG
mmetsp:Transcript_13776/g.46488  ORF Transcript_13776/g.46488 Transcript_13776/m.46488 type:complete len:111 (-) Transcript_13776:4-336(-)